MAHDEHLHAPAGARVRREAHEDHARQPQGYLQQYTYKDIDRGLTLYSVM